MKVYTLTIDGAGCTFPESKLKDLLEDLKTVEVGNTVSVEVKEMSEEEYNKLPEFNGY